MLGSMPQDAGAGLVERAPHVVIVTAGLREAV
jgi:hypothetical protein